MMETAASVAVGQPAVTTLAEPAPGHPVPRRVLVVSAEVGDGHDAAGEALREQVEQLWPGSQVGWVDTLNVVGSRLGRASRRAYLSSIRLAPWLYQFFYTSLWRHRWFATATKQLCGAWAGRRLAPDIEAFDPDLVVSTYPLGTAGLAWLRRHRGLGVPVGAWIADFAPHPFWLYPEIDLHLVPDPGAAPVAAAAAPAAAIAVADPPVSRRFKRVDRAAARRALGVDPQLPVVLVTCGSLGLGAMEEAVRALVAPGGPGQVLAVCGRNRRLARRLAEIAAPPQRLRVLGWVDDLAGLTTAADVVVTNGGAGTAQEALAAGTPVVLYRPITAHGVANAAILASGGLAEICRTPASLAAVVSSRLASRQPLAQADAERRAPTAGGRSARSSDGQWPSLPELGLPAVAAAPAPADPGAGRPGRHSPGRRPASWPLRSQDAFFQYVQTPAVAQQIGAVLEVAPRPDGRPLELADLVALLRQRVPAITTLRRQVVSRGRLRRPGWRLANGVEVAEHVHEHRLAEAAGEAAAAAVIDQFWTAPLGTDRPPWQVLLVTGLPGGRVKVAMKLHHCLGDGRSAVGTLLRLLDPAKPAGDRSTGDGRRDLLGKRPAPAWSGGMRRAGELSRGLIRLATTGRAPRTAVNQPLATPSRRLVTTALPAAEVSRAARAHRAHPCELVCALVAEALQRTYPAVPPARLRAMFAVSSRSGRRAPTYGNWTGAVALDLPLSDLPVDARIDLVRDRLRQGLASGQPAAAELVMRALGRLPGPIHAAAARWIYTSRFMNLIVSYVTGATGPQTVAGAPIRSAVPVVALADGVPLGVGVMRWADTIGIGVLLDRSLDRSLAGGGDGFVAALHSAFQELPVVPDRVASGVAGRPDGASLATGGAVRCG